MAILLLVRHAHSTANEAGILSGWTPGVHLTDRGRTQAAAVADLLRGIPLARLVVSPLERAAETAAGLDAAPVTDPDVGECHYGGWTGRALTDVARDPLWRAVQDAPDTVVFPEGAYAAESLAAMSARVCAALARHDAEVEAAHGPGAIWAVVSHGDPIRAALADATGAGLSHLQRFHVDPASVSLVRRIEGRPVLLGVGVGGDLTRLVAGDHAAASGPPVGGGGG